MCVVVVPYEIRHADVVAGGSLLIGELFIRTMRNI